MLRLIDRFFHLEEINGGERCPTYLYRWTLVRLGKWLAVYVHHFVGDDWTTDFHDHPKRFVSIGIAGEYTEETPSGSRVFRAPWIRTFPAEHVHRISLHKGTCWTIAIVFKAIRPWGFITRNGWVPWRQYVGSSQADQATNC